jgi:hypothetical protein
MVLKRDGQGSSDLERANEYQNNWCNDTVLEVCRLIGMRLVLPVTDRYV